MKQWLNDLRWALLMVQVRRIRRELKFGRRLNFDNAIRPQYVNSSGFYSGGTVMDYPDAIYHIKIEDVERAILRAAPHT